MIEKINYILTLKQKLLLLGLAVLLFIGGLFDLMGVSLVLPIVNMVTNPDIVNSSELAMGVKAALNINSDRAFIILLISTMIVVYIVKNIYIIMMYNVMYRLIWGFKAKLSNRLLTCYMYQDYTFHLNKNVSEIQRNILTDVGQFFGFITDILNTFNQTIVCIMLAVYLMIVDWATTIGVVVLLGGAIIFLYKKQKSVQAIRGKINREAAAEMNKWIIQSFDGIKEIKVLGREEYFLNKCKKAYNKGMSVNLKSNLAAIIPKPIMEMICVSGLLIIILIRILIGGDLSEFVSIMAVFAVAAFRMLPCFNSISAYMSSMLFEKDSVDAVYYDIKEMEALGENSHASISKNILEFKNKIVVDDVSYKYPNTNRWILRDVSLCILKNQSVGFVGTSGAGKSTLIDIILGVLPISYGQIKIDGVDIKDNLKEWHNMIGYIPQTIYLMDDTIRNNVAFGINENKISESKIWKALSEAQIDEFVRGLPNGLDTEIGDRGVRISGGQRQRLGIARALYNDPDILVFDEATSALDNETETALMEAINGLKGKRTMLIIAHRLHTIENCDVIYEVCDGMVNMK